MAGRKGAFSQPTWVAGQCSRNKKQTHLSLSGWSGLRIHLVFVSLGLALGKALRALAVILSMSLPSPSRPLCDFPSVKQICRTPMTVAWTARHTHTSAHAGTLAWVLTQHLDE